VLIYPRVLRIPRLFTKYLQLELQKGNNRSLIARRTQYNIRLFGHFAVIASKQCEDRHLVDLDYDWFYDACGMMVPNHNSVTVLAMSIIPSSVITVYFRNRLKERDH
jgi:hypothetical protein